MCLCEKPMTMTVEEGEEIVKIAEKSGKICAVNYCYSALTRWCVKCVKWCARARLAKCASLSPISAMATMVTQRMRIIHAFAGGMTLKWPVFRANSPIVASMPCIWQVLLPMMKYGAFRQILLQPSSRELKMMRWSISVWRGNCWSSLDLISCDWSSAWF